MVGTTATATRAGPKRRWCEMKTWKELYYRQMDMAHVQEIVRVFAKMLEKRSVRRDASRVLSWWKRDYLGRKTGTLMQSESGDFFHALAVSCFRLAIAHDEICLRRPRLLARYPVAWKRECFRYVVDGARIAGIGTRYIDALLYDLTRFEDMMIRKEFGPTALDELLARYKN